MEKFWNTIFIEEGQTERERERESERGGGEMGVMKVTVTFSYF